MTGHRNAYLTMAYAVGNLEIEILKLRAAIDRVRELHQDSCAELRAAEPDNGWAPWCGVCEEGWPCPTIEALDQIDEEST